MSAPAAWLRQITFKQLFAPLNGEPLRVGIGGALVDNFSIQQVCSAIIEHALSSGKSAYVTKPNAQPIVLLKSNEEFRAIYGG